MATGYDTIITTVSLARDGRLKLQKGEKTKKEKTVTKSFGENVPYRNARKMCLRHGTALVFRKESTRKL